MKRECLLILTIALSLFAFTACDDDLDVSRENVTGQWIEEYSDYPYFMPDGYISYDFKADGKVDIHVYDVFDGEHDYQKSYTVGTMVTTSGKEKDVVTFNPSSSDYSGESYKIVKLTKDEMEWQRVGTTFQKGTVGSDYKHLVRNRITLINLD